MHDNSNHIKQYSAATIQQYLKGQLPADTMHAIEKAALDDPFLADAIEGMELAMQDEDESVINAQLNSLRQQVQARASTPIQAAPVRSIRWWQVAAAAMLLITAGASVYYLLSPAASEKKPDLAIVTPAPQKAATPPPATVAQASGDTIVTYKEEKATADRSQWEKQSEPATYSTNANAPAKVEDRALLQKKVFSATHSADSIKDYASAAAPGAKELVKKLPGVTGDTGNVVVGYGTAKQQSADLASWQKADAGLRDVTIKADTVSFFQRDMKNNRPTETEVVTLGNLAKPQQSIIAGKTEFISTEQLNNNFINVRITDNKNNPLNNAYVRIENDKRSYLTDQDGYFKMPALPADSTVTVAVNAVGFNNQQFRLQNNTNYLQQLKLQPAVSGLNEVVAASKKENARALSTKYRRNQPTVEIQDAQPVGGWAVYEAYLAKNKKLPADNPNVTGNVVVSFDISKKGVLSGFTIDQSLNTAYDNEAIRLVKEGPTWQLLKGKKTRATVIVHF